MPKPTKAEYRRRIVQVRAMLATGATRADIQQHAAARWACNQRSTDALIAGATEELRLANEPTREQDVARARSVYTLILREQLGAKQFGDAARTQSRICQLLGLNAADRLEVAGPGGMPLPGMNTAELAALFEEKVWKQHRRLMVDRERQPTVPALEAGADAGFGSKSAVGEERRAEGQTGPAAGPADEGRHVETRPAHEAPKATGRRLQSASAPRCLRI